MAWGNKSEGVGSPWTAVQVKAELPWVDESGNAPQSFASTVSGYDMKDGGNPPFDFADILAYKYTMKKTADGKDYVEFTVLTQTDSGWKMYLGIGSPLEGMGGGFVQTGFGVNPGSRVIGPGTAAPLKKEKRSVWPIVVGGLLILGVGALLFWPRGKKR